jgi:hypothetical protein
VNAMEQEVKCYANSVVWQVAIHAKLVDEQNIQRVIRKHTRRGGKGSGEDSTRPRSR